MSEQTEQAVDIAENVSSSNNNDVAAAENSATETSPDITNAALTETCELNDNENLDDQIPGDDQLNDSNQSKSSEKKDDKGRISEPEQQRKLFVGGVNYRTDEESLRTYFGDHGEIVDCVVMRDPAGRSRGFAFVTFTSMDCVDSVMKSRPHVIDGRDLDVRRATPKQEAGKPGGQLSVRKLFIGGCREGIADNDLKEYFEKYGNVTDCVVMKDNDGKLRGFGFVTFDDYDPVDKVIIEKNHSINGHVLDVKKAMPKRRNPPNSGPYGRGFVDQHGGFMDGSPFDSMPGGLYGHGGGRFGGTGSGRYGGFGGNPMRVRRSGGGYGWNDRPF
ncbi:hypothetical protein GJ496_009650 [Pomphorhynchus laevis]|nr:hypothetical protein GJ496_009650 [Pomphorhynchus laevis]